MQIETKTQHPGVYRVTYPKRKGFVRFRGRLARNGKKIDCGYYADFAACVVAVEAARANYGKNFCYTETSTDKTDLEKRQTGKNRINYKSAKTRELESEIGRKQYELNQLRRELAALLQADMTARAIAPEVAAYYAEKEQAAQRAKLSAEKAARAAGRAAEQKNAARAAVADTFADIC